MMRFFDRNDTRSPKSRELSLFKNLRTIVAVAKPRAAGLRRILRDVDLAKIDSRDALTRLPILRPRDIEAMRADDPPYGGLMATRPGLLRRVSMDAPHGLARDWWNCARPLAAAGVGKGDIILNCYSYNLATRGFIVEDGAAEIGCAVIPAGSARIERKLREIHGLKPTAYCGDIEQLKQLLDHAAAANCDISSLRAALVFDNSVSRHLRVETESRGIRVHQAYVTPDFGVIAYETSLADGARNIGMIVNEGLILEIVKPGTTQRAGEGDVGEVVVTRVNADYPLLRMSTGDLSRVIPGPSPCGRTSPRIAGWLGRVDEVTLVMNREITPAHVLELGARHACVGRMQIVVDRRDGRDVVTLRAEGPKSDPQLHLNLKNNLLDVTGFDGEIEVVDTGVLADKRKLVHDRRL